VTVSAPRGRPLLADVVRSELKRLILGGEFPVGSKLPNEDRLCERFGVSRVTIREAVRGLIEDGLVLRRHGSGTYVTRRPLIRNSLDVN
jgi:DNA-binding GntR family transcriptional regulator